MYSSQGVRTQKGLTLLVILLLICYSKFREWGTQELPTSVPSVTQELPNPFPLAANIRYPRSPIPE